MTERDAGLDEFRRELLAAVAAMLGDALGRDVILEHGAFGATYERVVDGMVSYIGLRVARRDFGPALGAPYVWVRLGRHPEDPPRSVERGATDGGCVHDSIRGAAECVRGWLFEGDSFDRLAHSQADVLH